MPSSAVSDSVISTFTCIMAVYFIARQCLDVIHVNIHVTTCNNTIYMNVNHSLNLFLLTLIHCCRCCFHWEYSCTYIVVYFMLQECNVTVHVTGTLLPLRILPVTAAKSVNVALLIITPPSEVVTCIIHSNKTNPATESLPLHHQHQCFRCFHQKQKLR